MSPPVKLGAFAAALSVLFAAAVVGARAIDDDGLAERGGTRAHGNSHRPTPAEGPRGDVLPGLSTTQAGYRLEPEATALASGPSTTFRFRVTGPDGHAVERYSLLHERELHLIVVRRDLAGFQHVHPTRTDDGTWSTTLDLRQPGTWRVLADFAPAGGPAQLTLGIDVHVDGDRFAAAAAPAAAAATDARYEARLERTASLVTATVLRDGQPVQPEPYLGARGHLVALRIGDLAYLHVHPQDGLGPEVRFRAELPTAGRYALFFDYQLDGTVRTAAATTEVAR